MIDAINRFLCGLFTKHVDAMLVFNAKDKAKLISRCSACGHESPGWEV